MATKDLLGAPPKTIKPVPTACNKKIGPDWATISSRIPALISPYLGFMFLSSCYLWRFFAHSCSSLTPETDPCCATQGSNPDPSIWCLRSAEICGKIFGKMSETVFLTSWTSNTVEQGVQKMSENVGNLAANFLRTPEVQSALQTPLCTALSSFQFCSFGFSRLVANCHTSQLFEPSNSLPNSHGASAYNQAMEK